MAFTFTTHSAQSADALPALGATLDQLTVSGISSGGYMAVQFQVAHASLVTGAGILAAGPYGCADGSAWRATRNCMTPGSSSPPPDADETLALIDHHARSGRIDPRAALADDRVWLLSGANDRTVERPVVNALADVYRRVLAPGALTFVPEPDAGHAMLSVTDAKPNACPTSEPPFINRCGNLDAAGELLAHVLGTPPDDRPAASATPQGRLVEFDQRPFTDLAPYEIGMAERGYAYIPDACRNGACRVHVVFHGCRQSAAQIGTRFIDGAGYNRWADAHKLIVLYPQIAPRYGFAWGSWRWLYNPKGCWDWWGYTGSNYATRDGSQIRAVRTMLDRLAAQPN